MREALAHAIDQKSMVDGILLGLGQAISGPFPLTSWAYNHDVPPPNYDPEKAKALLAEAGWKPDAGGTAGQKRRSPFPLH